MTKISQAKTETEIAAARKLFREYETELDLDLCFQGFEAELATLPGKYSPPDGRLLLAFVGDKLAGCIAMRKLEDGVCEMKRLFVRDEFRGQKIGIALIERVINDACEIGYAKMRLDTSTLKMKKAISLYESYGFVRIAPYYENPHPGVLFMELAL